MVQPGTNDTDKLLTEVDGLHPWTLIVMTIPFLGAPLHLGSIVWSEG